MPEKMVYKSLNFKIEKQFEEDGFLNFSGYASTFGNVDSDGDTFVQGAFSESLEKETPKMLLMHNSRGVPIGVWVSLKEDKIGLFVEGKMPLDDDRVGKMIAPQMKVGSLDAMSIGFMNPVFDFDQGNTNRWGDPGRIYKKVDLKEISIVTFPANELARITAVKDLLKDSTISDDEKKELKKLFSGKAETKSDFKLLKSFSDYEFNSMESLASLRERTGSKGTPSETYKSGFLCYDETKTDDFDSYKYLIVDKDGNASKSAIVSIRVALEGSKGSIAAGNRSVITERVNQYYEKMGLEPFEENAKWTLPEIKLLGKSDLEFVVRSGKLSRSSSDYIASAVLSTQDKESTHTEGKVDMSKLAAVMDNILKTKE